MTEGAGTARPRPLRIFAIFHIALNYVPSGTQRAVRRDGPETDLKLRMLDARFSPVNGHYQLDQSCPKTCTKGDVLNRRAIMRATNKEAVAQF
jgi:hypothetical protein